MKDQKTDGEKKNRGDSYYLNIAVVIYVIVICGILAAFAIWLQMEHQVLGSW